jgi:hypothetical protein
MFICINSNEVGEGQTLEEAHEDLKQHSNEDCEVEYCSFYEVGEPIDVEVKIVPKQVITKAKK